MCSISEKNNCYSLTSDFFSKAYLSRFNDFYDMENSLMYRMDEEVSQRDRDITFVFTGFIHHVLKNEKALICKRVSNETKRKELEAEYFEKVQETLVEPNEKLEDFKVAFLEDFFQDMNLSISVEKLTLREKMIIFRRFVLEERDHEIGRYLGISSQAVSKQRRKILSKLKYMLNN